MSRCFVVPGPFLPYNDTITQLVYKHLRLLDMEYTVCALTNPKDKGFERQLQDDPNWSKFHVCFSDKYDNVLFSIKNVNLFKGLKHMKRYIDTAVSMYDNQPFLYTNSWPCYTTRVGVALKKMNPDIRWIASFSDPINHSPYKYDKETYKAYSLPEKICFNLYCKYYVVDEDEANAFEQADILVFICEEQRDFMLAQYEKYFHRTNIHSIKKKCVIVPLNYIPEWNAVKPVQVKKKSDAFILSHFGRIYGFRLTAEFIHAVNQFINEYPDFKLHINQYGEFRKSDWKLISHLKLNSVFTIHKKVPYLECIQKMNESDAVLLFDTILPETEYQPYLPSKILEYSLLQKDVLAVTTSKSPTYRIMKKTNAIACQYDRNDIYNGLVKLLIERQNSKIDYAISNQEAVCSLTERIAML